MNDDLIQEKVDVRIFILQFFKDSKCWRMGENGKSLGYLTADGAEVRITKVKMGKKNK